MHHKWEWLEIYKTIARIALPAIGCQFCRITQEVNNVVFVGQMENEVKLTGVGMGNVLVFSFGIGVYIGLNTALSTFVSQA